MQHPVVDLRNIVKRYGNSPVLNDVSLQVREGEIVAIIGPSGAGKSTLLRLVNQLETHQGGVVRIDGDVIPPNASAHQLARLRTKVGMVFQSFNLWPHLTAAQNVMEGPTQVLRWPRARAEAKAAELLARVGLHEHGHKYPAQLSGGQQQRVAIARALAMQPHVMLFDEATSALDPALVNEVLKVMTTLARKCPQADDMRRPPPEGAKKTWDGPAFSHARMTMLVVTHEMRFARQVADRIVFMAGGEILEQADPETFFTAPQHPKAREFVASLSH